MVRTGFELTTFQVGSMGGGGVVVASGVAIKKLTEPNEDVKIPKIGTDTGYCKPKIQLTETEQMLVLDISREIYHIHNYKKTIHHTVYQKTAGQP